MKRRRAERGGRRAESIAAFWLRLKGWRILARRVRTQVGEIDLIARRGRTIIFVEVKSRSTSGQAAMSLDDWRLRRVAAAAEALLPRFARPDDEVRIDAIYVVPRRFPCHLANISQG